MNYTLPSVTDLTWVQLSNERLAIMANGDVRLVLKTPWANATKRSLLILLNLPTGVSINLGHLKGCLIPGQALAFTVSGQISHGSDAPTDADGTKGEVVAHLNAGAYGKSDVRAPINSLLGVFLGADDPSPLPAPAGLDFTGEDARNLSLLKPAIGQVFFIGTGKTASGEMRKVVVPTGTEHLYFGIMDAFEWHNNTGSLSGAIQSSSIINSP